jgi:hypothetical protein
MVSSPRRFPQRPDEVPVLAENAARDAPGIDPWESRMAEEMIIARVDERPRDRFADMLTESEASGYQFLRRVASEWEDGVCRFSRPGEALLVRHPELHSYPGM